MNEEAQEGRRSRRARKTPEHLIFRMGFEPFLKNFAAPVLKKQKTLNPKPPHDIEPVGVKQKAMCPFCSELVLKQKLKRHIDSIHHSEMCSEDLFEEKDGNEADRALEPIMR